VKRASGDVDKRMARVVKGGMDSISCDYRNQMESAIFHAC
jgi:hypothetical protein